MVEPPVRVLFVCTGNICRSPTAEGVFRKLVADAGLAERVEIASAGTGDYHVGEAPDRRAQAAARRRGYDLSEIRAQQVRVDDLMRCDFVLAMDRSHLAALQRLDPTAEGRISLFLDFAPESSMREVPDPYYGAGDGFERVLDLIVAASEGLLAAVAAELERDRAGETG